MQSVSIDTNVVSSNPAYGDVYSMSYYVIKFVSDLRVVGDFLQVVRFPQPIVVVIISSYCAHSGFITRFKTRVTRQLQLVKQEILTITENLISPPMFQSFPASLNRLFSVQYFVDPCQSFCFFRPNALFVLLLCTTSDYPFGIFKLFCHSWFLGIIHQTLINAALCIMFQIMKFCL